MCRMALGQVVQKVHHREFARGRICVRLLRQDDGADCFRSPRVGGTPRERAGEGVIALNGDGSAEFRETASQKGSGGAPALLAASGSAVCV